MDPSSTGNLPTPKLNPSSQPMRPGTSSLGSSASSSTPEPKRHKVTLPTPPTTPSPPPSATSPQISPRLYSRSSSLSTLTTPFPYQPSRSFSQPGRSQLNAAASTGSLFNGSSAAAVPSSPVSPEPGRKLRPLSSNTSFLMWFHFAVFLQSVQPSLLDTVVSL